MQQDRPRVNWEAPPCAAEWDSGRITLRLLNGEEVGGHVTAVFVADIHVRHFCSGLYVGRVAQPLDEVLGRIGMRTDKLRVP